MFTFKHLTYPVIQAPMAGGPNTAAMVSTVVNLGAVGSYGFAYSTAEKIAQDLKDAKALVNKRSTGALNANFFVFHEVDTPEQDVIDAAIESLRPLYPAEIGLKIPQPPYFPDLNSQLEPVWQSPPDILTFHFGIPAMDIIEKAHSLDIAVGITATSPNEAQLIEQAGADFIVAQGVEAGGHRGIFDQYSDDARLPTIKLVKSITDIIRIPIVAAGGIMNSAHVNAALSAGAIAVQMGTAFLTTRESGASPAHKRYLVEETHRRTCTTLGFSGRPARGIDNAFIQAMVDEPVLPFPLQNSLTVAIRAQASADDNGEYQSLWAGSGFAECRDETIAELFCRLFDKTEL